MCRASSRFDEGHLYPAGTVSGVSISGLLAGVEYQVRVRARYGGWSGPWSEARRAGDLGEGFGKSSSPAPEAGRRSSRDRGGVA